VLGGDGLPAGAQGGAQVLERLGLADLLEAEDVGGDLLDRRLQVGQLGVVGRLGRRAGGGARPEEVLQVPRRDRQHHSSFAASMAHGDPNH
jgi:hypothetical protein